MNDKYVGRFAPSPSGPLHFGSLVAALASYLDARANKGLWLLRIEDLDPPRESAEAPGQIMRQLEHFGLTWDKKPLFQSTRLTAYQQALEQLTDNQLTYPCTCSRKRYEGRYPGRCRGCTSTAEPHAVRVLTKGQLITFTDLIQGLIETNFDQTSGDFIIRRKDGLFAYQLAVTVDDLAQGITRVVRGIDLLDSTPRQCLIAKLLESETPEYAHFPVVTGKDGHKLSKQAHAAPVDTNHTPRTLNLALTALGQQPIAPDNPENMLAEAVSSWDLRRVPRQPQLAYEDLVAVDSAFRGLE